MSVHQSDRNRAPDSEFQIGSWHLLCEGNHGRLLDRRRTPGVVEQVFRDTGMFRWRITAFEDQGKYWDLPIERVRRFHFARDSKQLTAQEALQLEELAVQFAQPLIIAPDLEARASTDAELRRLESGIDGERVVEFF